MGQMRMTKSGTLSDVPRVLRSSRFRFWRKGIHDNRECDAPAEPRWNLWRFAAFSSAGASHWDGETVVGWEV
jgi:hypothetical protein